MSLSRTILLSIPVVIALAPRPARAAPPPPADPMTETARTLYDAGKKAADQKQWEECRAKLLAAWATKHHAQIASLLSRCEMKLEMNRDAAEHATVAIELDEKKDPTFSKVLADALVEAKKKVGTVTIVANVDGSEIVVDGKVVGKTPFTIFLGPGTHRFDALHDGYTAPATASLEIQAGAEPQVSIELKKTAGAAPPIERTASKHSLVPAFVLGGIGALGAIGGAIALGVAAGKHSDAVKQSDAIRASNDGNCDNPGLSIAKACGDLRSTTASAGAVHDAGIGLLVGGGAVMLAGGGYAIWALASRPEAAKVGSAGFRVLPTLGGAQVQGSF